MCIANFSARQTLRECPDNKVPPLNRVSNLFMGSSLRSVCGTAEAHIHVGAGRTHQIRVHMTWRGYPLVGDDMYGGKHVTERDLGGTATTMLLARQALHATTLGFRHPMTETPMMFTAPVAADLQRALELLRGSQMSELLTPPGATIDLASAGV